MIDDAVHAKGLRPTPFAIAQGVTTRHVAEKLGIIDNMKRMLQDNFCHVNEAREALLRYLKQNAAALDTEQLRAVRARMQSLLVALEDLQRKIASLQAPSH